MLSPGFVAGRPKRTQERDLEIGRQIQASFLPAALPDPAGWEIARYFKPSREVSGDFYDGFYLSNGKRIGLVVADVCDKGVGAALFMALFRSLIHAFAEQHTSLGWMDVISGDASTQGGTDLSVGRRRNMLATGATALKNAIDQTNNYIVRNHEEAGMFATVFFAVLDPATGQLMYINAGHEPPYLVRGGKVIDCLMPTGPALGLFPDQAFSIGQIELLREDLLLAYTDGVTDAQNRQAESFGEQRLKEAACNPGSAIEILDHIYHQIQAFIQAEDQFDDITMLAARRLA